MELQVTNQNGILLPTIINYPKSIERITINDDKPVRSTNTFVEANTKEVSLSHLKNDCIIPVFAKDNETSISHYDFIDVVAESVNQYFPMEQIDTPNIRISHPIKGRIPEAVHKPVEQLLENEKTIYYERMAFMLEIPTITEQVNGNTLNLTIGGVRAYNHENLYSKKGMEKFKLFIGFQNLVCTNLCVSTDGYASEIRVSSAMDLREKVFELFKNYQIKKHLETMKALNNYSLSEHQFAQLIGKSRLYQHLPSKQKKEIPSLELNDSQINLVAKDYYTDDNFQRFDDGSISLWRMYNLFTGANRSSYIDTFLDRAVNATNFVEGIASCLNGKSGYNWFIQ